MCDEGHQWTFFRDEECEEKPEDRICPHGHEAVTLKKERALNDVVVTLRPAGRVVDFLRNQEAMRGSYYVVLSNIEGTEELVSEGVYNWEDACKFARKFDKRSFDWACKYWNQLGSSECSL